MGIKTSIIVKRVVGVFVVLVGLGMISFDHSYVWGGIVVIVGASLWVPALENILFKDIKTGSK
jgi:hypothetical protein